MTLSANGSQTVHVWTVRERLVTFAIDVWPFRAREVSAARERCLGHP